MPATFSFTMSAIWSASHHIITVSSALLIITESIFLTVNNRIDFSFKISLDNWYFKRISYFCCIELVELFILIEYEVGYIMEHSGKSYFFFVEWHFVIVSCTSFSFTTITCKSSPVFECIRFDSFWSVKNKSRLSLLCWSLLSILSLWSRSFFSEFFINQ